MFSCTDSIRRVLSLSKLHPGTKISTFVPLRGMDVPAMKIFAGIRKVASKLAKDKMRPLSSPLINWAHWSESGAHTLGIFETEDELTVIPLSFIMTPRVVVADTFHIKPLLLEEDYAKHALVLHFNQTGAALFLVGLNTSEQVCRYIPPLKSVIPDWPYRIMKNDLLDYLCSIKEDAERWVSPTTAFVSITGCENPRLRPEGFWKILHKPIMYPVESFYKDSPRDSLSVIRHQLRQSIDRSQREFVSTHSVLIGRSDPKQKLEAVVEKINQRTLRSLCVSLEDLRFGKLDSHGKVHLTRAQADSEDDDLLDDIAEQALSNGIKVRVMPKKYMPIGENLLVG